MMAIGLLLLLLRPLGLLARSFAEAVS